MGAHKNARKGASPKKYGQKWPHNLKKRPSYEEKSCKYTPHGEKDHPTRDKMSKNVPHIAKKCFPDFPGRGGGGKRQRLPPLPVGAHVSNV